MGRHHILQGLAGPMCTLLSNTQQEIIHDTHIPGPIPGRWGVGAGHRSEHIDRASRPHAADAAGCSSRGRGGSVSRRPPGRVEMCLVFAKLGAGLLVASTGWRTRTGNTQDRRPQGVTQPQAPREQRQRSAALGRDSRPDERGKPALARRC